LSDWKKNVVLKKLWDCDAVSMSYAFITQFVNMINCINFPFKGDDFSFVSISLAAHQPWIESMSDCGSVPSVASLLCKKFLILSAKEKYLFKIINNNNSSIAVYYSSNLNMQIPITKL
jgi:hypothetical protein